jgi:hypothetical protein
MGAFDPVIFIREICRVELNLPVAVLARTNGKVWHVSFLTIQDPPGGSVNVELGAQFASNNQKSFV